MVEDEPAYAVELAPIRPPTGRGPRRRRTLAVVAILLIGSGSVAVILARPPAPPGGTSAPRVALVDPGGALAILDASGRSRITLSGLGTTITFPAWSPDGSRVAAIAESTVGIDVDVFPALPPTQTPSHAPTVVYRSATSPPFYVYWTPDGRRLAFLTTEGAGIALRDAPADASSEAAVVRTGAPMYWAWQDSTHLLVHSGGSASDAFLGVVAGDGSAQTTVSRDPGLFRSPAVTADGRLRAYVAMRPDGSGRVVESAADGSASHEAPVFGPAAVGFAPDGSALAFIGPDQAVSPVPPVPLGPLRIMDVRSGEIRTPVASGAIAFFWSPDARMIAVIAVAGGVGPGVAGAAGPAVAPGLGETAGRARLTSAASSRPPLGPSAADQPGFDVSLAFVDIASGAVRAQRTIRISPLFASQVLPYFDQYALSHRLWSPDSASILLPLVAEDGSDRLEVLPADGSAPRELAPGSIGFWSP